MALIGNHRVIIAGSRASVAQRDVNRAMERYVDAYGVPTQIIHGGAPGADRFGHAWARIVGIPVLVMEPDWQMHGRAAGPIRNRAMADCAQGLVAVWNGMSPGTESMIRAAQYLRLKIVVYRVPSPEKLR